jgi:hypothetical protein
MAVRFATEDRRPAIDLIDLEPVELLDYTTLKAVARLSRLVMPCLVFPMGFLEEMVLGMGD